MNIPHDLVNSDIPVAWDAEIPHCLSVIELDFMLPAAKSILTGPPIDN